MIVLLDFSFFCFLSFYLCSLLSFKKKKETFWFQKKKSKKRSEIFFSTPAYHFSFLRCKNGNCIDPSTYNHVSFWIYGLNAAGSVRLKMRTNDVEVGQTILVPFTSNTWTYHTFQLSSFASGMVFFVLLASIFFFFYFFAFWVCEKRKNEKLILSHVIDMSSYFSIVFFCFWYGFFLNSVLLSWLIFRRFRRGKSRTFLSLLLFFLSSLVCFFLSFSAFLVKEMVGKPADISAFPFEISFLYSRGLILCLCSIFSFLVYFVSFVALPFPFLIL